jgi:predicted pyridoxine 5'-phosphate oxidase superfamily flavin-nucleotide-binding protein
MSKIYSEQHRTLQDAFDTRNLADAVEASIVHQQISAEEKAFIESRQMFFLSTVDHQGRPSVSYKGGEKGFVSVVDARTLAFPSYDGNGMFLSMGNLSANPQVGLLFIDFENPHRIRAYGEASIDPQDPLLAQYTEAQLIVRITITELWMNCPRYIHKHQQLDTSEFVPQAGTTTPLPDWKKLDAIQGVLPASVQDKVQQHGGTITLAQYQQQGQRDDS